MKSIIVVDSNGREHFFNASTHFVCALPADDIVERTKLVYQSGKEEKTLFVDGNNVAIWEQILQQSPKGGTA